MEDDKFIRDWMSAVQARGRNKPAPTLDPPPPDPERTAFEQEALRRGWNIERRGHGLLTYKKYPTQAGWIMWQVRSTLEKK